MIFPSSFNHLRPRIVGRGRQKWIKNIASSRSSSWIKHHAQEKQSFALAQFSNLCSPGPSPVSNERSRNDKTIHDVSHFENAQPNFWVPSFREDNKCFPLLTSMKTNFRRNSCWSSTLSMAGYSSTSITSGLMQRSQSTISTDSQQNAHKLHNEDEEVKNQHEKKENAAKRRKRMRKAATGFKDLMKKYGWTFVGTYAGVYFATLGTFFVAINWGWMDPPSLTLGDWGGGNDTILEGIGVPLDEATELKQRQAEGEAFSQKWVIDQMKSYEWTAKYADKLAKNPNWINLGVAWIAVKFTEPLRLGLAIGITPRVARFLGKAPKDDLVEVEDEQIPEKGTNSINEKVEDKISFSVKEEKLKN